VVGEVDDGVLQAALDVLALAEWAAQMCATVSGSPALKARCAP